MCGLFLHPYIYMMWLRTTVSKSDLSKVIMFEECGALVADVLNPKNIVTISSLAFIIRGEGSSAPKNSLHCRKTAFAAKNGSEQDFTVIPL